VVVGQRVEKESETLRKDSVGRIAIQPGSVSNEFGQERHAPGNHASRSWPETLKIADEAALNVQVLHSLFLMLRKDVDKCMEYLRLGRNDC
jgi:hypothetical protein